MAAPAGTTALLTGAAGRSRIGKRINAKRVRANIRVASRIIGAPVSGG
jgi:hypothetical protein